MKPEMKDEYWKGQAVEVRLRHGEKETWIRARVDSPTRRGANVTNNTDNRQHHVFFRDLRAFTGAATGLPGRAVKTIGTPVLDPGWVERARKIQAEQVIPKGAVQLSVVPKEEVQEIQKLSVPEIVELKTFIRGPIHQRKTRNHHNITPFAAFLRVERLRRSKTQEQMAEILKIDPKRIGRLELAVLWPNDDVLLAISENLPVDLDRLLALRDGKSAQEQHEEPALPFPAQSFAAVQSADTLVSVAREQSNFEALASRLVELKARAEDLRADLGPVDAEIETIRTKLKELL